MGKSPFHLQRYSLTVLFTCTMCLPIMRTFTFHFFFYVFKLKTGGWPLTSAISPIQPPHSTELAMNLDATVVNGHFLSNCLGKSSLVHKSFFFTTMPPLSSSSWTQKTTRSASSTGYSTIWQHEDRWRVERRWEILCDWVAKGDLSIIGGETCRYRVWGEEREVG